MILQRTTRRVLKPTQRTNFIPPSCTGTYKYIWVDYTCEEGSVGDTLEPPMCPTFKGTLYLDLDYNSLDAQSLTTTLNSWASEERGVDDIIEWVYSEGSVAATFEVHTEADRDALLAGAGSSLPAPFDGVILYGSPITTTTTTPAPCLPGTERDVGTGSCVACSAGTANGQVEGTCAPCTEGSVAATAGATACVPCLAGEESNAELTACVSCEPGTFSASDGSATCQACASGSVSAEEGSSTCDVCAAGTYANADRTACLACTAGSISAAGATSCAVCDSGTFANVDTCEPCAAGTANPTAGQTACAACADGAVAPTAGATHCTVCDAGTFASADNTACMSCAAGSVSGNGQDACTVCSAGTYATSDASTCEACPEGAVSSTAGSTECTACAAGTAASADATTCDPCAAGSVSSAGAAACVACDAGTEANVGQTQCVACAAGQFSDVQGGACQQCAAGHVSTTAGSTQCEACSLGSAPNAFQTACDACAPGTFADTVGAETCEACPSGTYADIAGAASCATCAPGEEPNTLRTACVACGPGTYSVDGTSCEVCPAGSLVQDGGSACVATTTSTTTTSSAVNPAWGRCKSKDIIVVQEGKAWVDANAYCASQFGPQATLFQPGDEMEATLIASELTKLAIARAWIGMREPQGFTGTGINQQTTGGYVDDGQGGYTLTSPVTVDELEYFVWGVDMPVNTAGEDCVIANRFVKNRVDPCGTLHSFVCQRPASVRPNAVQDQCVENVIVDPRWHRCGASELYLGGSGLLGEDDSLRTFEQARSKCAAEGGALLVPGNQDEANFAAFLISENSVVASTPRALVDAIDSAAEANVYRTPDSTQVDDLDYFVWGSNMPSRAASEFPPPTNGRACVVGNVHSKYRVMDCNKPWFFLCHRAQTGLADECSAGQGGIPLPATGVEDNYGEQEGATDDGIATSAALTGGVIATVLLAVLLVFGALMIAKARNAGVAAAARKRHSADDGMTEGLFNPLYAAPPMMANAFYDMASGGSQAEYCQAIDLNDAELASFEPSPACSGADSIVVSPEEEPEEMQ
jgi:hypothetical protein